MIENALKIPGWMDNRELMWLARMAQECKIIVEFGSYKGRSTRALAENTTGVVYAVDPWDGLYFDKNDTPMSLTSTDDIVDFIKNLRDLIEIGRVYPYCTVSSDFVFPNHSDKADLVFIDGDHRYKQVKKDIEVAKSIIRPGGVICGHDYNHSDWPGVKQAVDEIFNGDVKTVNTIWWIRSEQ